MKRVLFIAVIFIFIVVGCNYDSRSSELIEYDKEVINSLDKLNELAFNLAVPNLLPFEPIEAKIDMMSLGGIENSFITISFIHENLSKITL